MKLGPLQQSWIAALRSGQYPQTHTHLHDDKGYCCLGVATEVVCGVQPVHVLSYGIRYFSETNSGFLPPEVVDRMKFYCSEGKHRDEVGGENSEEHALWRLNDTFEKSFEEIASIIEADPSAYFSEEA